MRKSLIILICSLLLVSCVAPQRIPDGVNIETEATSAGIYSWHDDKNDVTCWIYSANHQGGIDCIPDWQLEEPK